MVSRHPSLQHHWMMFWIATSLFVYICWWSLAVILIPSCQPTFLTTTTFLSAIRTSARDWISLFPPNISCLRFSHCNSRSRQNFAQPLHVCSQPEKNRLCMNVHGFWKILGRVRVRLASMKQLKCIHVIELPEDCASLHHAGHQLLGSQVEQLIERLCMIQS